MSETPSLDSLIDVVRKGDVDQLEQLIGDGAPVTGQTPEGNTALMYAAAKGKVAVITRLIAAGSDVRHKNKWGLTPGDWAKWGPDEAATLRALANA